MALWKRARFNAIAAHYAALESSLIETPSNRWATDPYAWSEIVVMTPIENAIWTDIRCEGVVLYPQYPVGRYFVDFANPRARVALECDGKEWHQDQAKDDARQDDIESWGWTVYRIGGSDCLRADRYEDDDCGNERFYPGPARQLIRHIARRHGLDARTPVET